ncbi:hypothetical protein EVAR_43786_1 [Eumeta japonica]|uniref:Uncharacterized protein n=1 Tax=Eumeta variegata TaxID=151549 RepID=A0A4C1XYI8_EUMVA|nr:hypothetical protein EVAR_43786_1 [Eumeta japonica]
MWIIKLCPNPSRTVVAVRTYAHIERTTLVKSLLDRWTELCAGFINRLLHKAIVEFGCVKSAGDASAAVITERRLLFHGIRQAALAADGRRELLTERAGAGETPPP